MNRCYVTGLWLLGAILGCSTVVNASSSPLELWSTTLNVSWASESQTDRGVPLSIKPNAVGHPYVAVTTDTGRADPSGRPYFVTKLFRLNRSNGQVELNGTDLYEGLRIQLQTAVGDGRIYDGPTLDGMSVYGPDQDGKELVAVTYAGPYSVGGEDPGATLSLFDAQDESRSWKASVVYDRSSRAMVGAPQFDVTGSTIYTASRHSGRGRNTFGQITAFDASNGTQLWTNNNRTDGNPLPDFSGLTLGGSLLYAAASGGQSNLRAFSVQDGSISDETDNAFQTQYPPVAFEDYIYVDPYRSTSGNTTMLKLKADNLADSIALTEYNLNTERATGRGVPLLNSDGTVIFVIHYVCDGGITGSCSSDDAVLSAFDTTTGEELWAFDIDKRLGRMVLSPDGSQIYIRSWLRIGNNDPNYAIHGVDTETGALVWTLETNPCEALAMEVAPSEDGTLYYICAGSSRDVVTVFAVDPYTVVTPSPSNSPSVPPTNLPTASPAPSMTDTSSGRYVATTARLYYGFGLLLLILLTV